MRVGRVSDGTFGSTRTAVTLPYGMPRSSVPLALLAFQLLTSCAGSTWSRLQSDLDWMVHRAAGGATLVSARVVSLATGEIVYDRHPAMLMHPASTMKLVTVAAALSRGLAGKTISTTLSGAADGQGPLYLRGGGDPLLSAAELGGMVDQLRARGIGTVTGPVVVDAGLFTGPRFGFGWMWDDEPASFMPHVSALTVAGGCVEVEVDAETIDVVGRPEVSVFPESEHLTLVNLATVGVDAATRGGEVIIDRDWQNGGQTITVRGHPRRGERTTRRLSVPLPEVFAGRVLKAHLVAEGLAGDDLEVATLAGEPGAWNGIGLELARVDRSVAAVIREIVKDSDNLAAECLLRLLAVHQGIRPADGRRATMIVQDYVRELGLDPNAYRLVDGSGLSHLNLLSSELLVAVLADMRRRARTAQLFEAALPIAGVDGTLRLRMLGTPAAGRMRAKTGTLSGVSALAGYVQTAEGEPLAFAFLMQNFVGASAPWRDLQDQMAVRLAQARRGE